MVLAGTYAWRQVTTAEAVEIQGSGNREMLF